MNYRKVFHYSIISCLFLCIFGIRIHTLNKSIHPNGTDGYYYAVQARTFAQTGSFYYPTTASGTYMCGLFAKIFGDPILSCKIQGAFAASLLCLSVFIFAYIFFEWDFCFATFCMALTGVLPSVTQMSVNHINNLTANAFFLLSASFTLLCLKNRTRRSYFIPSMIFFALALLTNIITTFYSLAFFAIVVYEKISQKFKYGILFALGIAFCWLTYLEFDKFTDAFSFKYCIPVFSKTIIENTNIFLAVELTVITSAAWICSFLLCLKDSHFNVKVLLLPVFAFPFFDLRTSGIGYRILLSSSPFCAIFVIYTARELLQKHKVKVNQKIFWPVILVTSALIFLTPNLYDLHKEIPYDYYIELSQKINLKEDETLVCNRTFANVYTYYNKNAVTSLTKSQIDDPQKAYHLADINAIMQNSSSDTDIFELPEFTSQALIPLDTAWCLIRHDLWLQIQ